MPGRRLTDSQIQVDHDILVEIKTEVGFIRTEVKDLKDNTTGRITALESQKAAISVTADHEVRIRLLEKWGWKAIGALVLIQFLIGTYVAIKK